MTTQGASNVIISSYHSLITLPLSIDEDKQESCTPNPLSLRTLARTKAFRAIDLSTSDSDDDDWFHDHNTFNNPPPLQLELDFDDDANSDDDLDSPATPSPPATPTDHFDHLAEYIQKLEIKQGDVKRNKENSPFCANLFDTCVVGNEDGYPECAYFGRVHTIRPAAAIAHPMARTRARRPRSRSGGSDEPAKNSYVFTAIHLL